MNRNACIQRLEAEPGGWDFIVVGGGATGLGAAVEAAARGYRTLLVEQGDFARATSSRSTKLIHGGVRYLRQGNIQLVRESLRERGLLLRNAPGIVHSLAFALPAHSWWELGWYGTGLKLYDALAGGLGLGASRWLGRDTFLQEVPTIAADGLKGGVRYQDAQFDDARLALALAQTLLDLGGLPLNYVRVEALIKDRGRIRGVVACDLETGASLKCSARVVINATGIFSDAVRRLDEPNAPRRLTLSQGAHVVLDRSLFPGTTALIVPRTVDGRVLFAIPWLDRVLVGTTDTPVEEPDSEPRPLTVEVDYLLDHIGRHLVRAPARTDVLSAWAGLRPLVGSNRASATARLPRDHDISVSKSGLVSIAGGKWTTYRKMGEDVIDAAEPVAGLQHRPSRTATLMLHEPRSSAAGVRERLHPRLSVTAEDVQRAVREEAARTVEDMLARRSRALLLDARAAIEVSSRVTAIMAQELERDAEWEMKQVVAFEKLAAGYLP
ncbi:MAG TPA: FAD-dependent oxidoreductase [Verrucomicrobiales bacterium]|nr:FAD-dependent oxidoreductase [Verrucomicrobiales bacterium]